MEIDVGILILVNGLPYALFDDGECYRLPADAAAAEDPLEFADFDEVIEFMNIE